LWCLNIEKPTNSKRFGRFAPGFVSYKKGCTRLAAASDKVYLLLAHDRWFSPGTLASSITKTGHHNIAEILLKVALNKREPPTMGKQLVNFITFGCQSSAPFFVIYKTGHEPMPYLIINAVWVELSL
jgi:hypothetical protein